MSENMMFYFHWDSKVWAITIAVLLFSLLLFLPVFLKRLHIIVRIVCPLSIFCFLPALLNMPLHMNLSENAFSARMLSFSIDIPYQQIDKTYAISRDDISGSIRTNASGGLFGYSGNFKNEKLGHYSMYATDLSQLFLIRTKEGKYYIFSSSERDKIMAAIHLNSVIR